MTAAQREFAPEDAAFLSARGFAPVPVTAVRRLAADVVEVELAQSTPFTPGSHLEVAMPGPRPADSDELFIRHYSLSSNPTGSTPWTIAVHRSSAADGHSTSQLIHDTLTGGYSLWVRGPMNSFHFRAARPALFVAGGIGITPLRAMAVYADELGLDWKLIYIGKDPEHMAYAEELAAAGERVQLIHTRRTGRPRAAELAAAWLAGRDLAHVYTCGPTELMDDLTRGLAAALPHTPVEREDFAADGPAHDLQAGAVHGGQPFTAELADGTEIHVGRDETLLEALNRCGVRALSSCRRGTCGTCETPILAGTAEHRDSVLSPEEHAAGQSMMICVSRSQGARITLDIRP